MKFPQPEEYDKRYSDESEIQFNSCSQSKLPNGQPSKYDPFNELRKADQNNSQGYKWKEKSTGSITDYYSSGNIDTLLNMSNNPFQKHRNKKNKDIEQQEDVLSVKYDTEFFDLIFPDNNQSIDFDRKDKIGSIIREDSETNLDKSEIKKKIKKRDNKKQFSAYLKKNFQIGSKTATVLTDLHNSKTPAVETISRTNYSQAEEFQAFNEVSWIENETDKFNQNINSSEMSPNCNENNPISVKQLIKHNYNHELIYRNNLNKNIYIRIMDNIFPIKVKKLFSKIIELKFGHLLENIKKIKDIFYSPTKRYVLLNIEDRDRTGYTLSATTKALEFQKIYIGDLEVKVYNDILKAIDSQIKDLIDTSFLNSIANMSKVKSNERDYVKKLNVQTKQYIISRPYISTTTKIDYFMKREEVISYKISENFMQIVKADHTNLDAQNWHKVLNCIYCKDWSDYLLNKVYKPCDVSEKTSFTMENIEKPHYCSDNFDITSLENEPIGSKVFEWREIYKIGAEKYIEDYMIISN